MDIRRSLVVWSLVVWWRAPTVLFFLVSRTFHDNRHANWGGVHNLDQRIWDIGLRHKRSPRHGSANINRIRGCVLHRFDAAARSGDHDARRICGHLFHAHTVRKISGHTWSHLNGASLTIIEGEVKLTGYDLHDFEILRHTNLPARQIESPFPGLHAGQINLRMHIRSLQLMNQTLRPPYPD